ncbi:MAG: hypothetical protein O3A46_01720 [Candidatus Poribacteria bacterium]|nr:hypothetical protein [Candidatus Poribacteria bacterium]
MNESPPESRDELELHPSADDAIADATRRFMTHVTSTSRGIASLQQADIVTRIHVEQALIRFYAPRERPRVFMLLALIGPAIFGAGISGFPLALEGDHNTLLVAFTIMSIVGGVLSAITARLDS